MKTILYILVIGLIGASIYAYLQEGGQGESPDARYEHAGYSLSFTYPTAYVLQEFDTQHPVNTTTGRHALVLTEREALANVADASEGPPTITIDVYPGEAVDGAVAWVESSIYSNYQLALGEHRRASVAGTDALTYTWDGLYRGESYVLAHKGNIVMISVTYLTEEDAIRSDFDRVFSSFRLTE